MRISKTGLALIGSAAILVVACGSSSTGGTNISLNSKYSAVAGTKGGKLIYSNWQKVDNLNTFASSSEAISVATAPLWSFTWEFDPQGKAVPDLVSEIPSTDNGDVKKVDDTHMDVTLKLKPGLHWSDGSDITADDVKFTVDSICNPNASFGNGTLGYDHIASQDVKDKTTLVWHFGPELTKSGKDSTGAPAYRCGLADKLDSGIYASWLAVMNFQPLPKAVLGTVDPGTWTTIDYFTKKPTVTSGPYILKDFSPGAAAVVTYTPNPRYGDGRSGASFFGHGAYLDQLQYTIYGSSPAMIAGLGSGSADIGINLIAADIPALSAISGRQTAVINGFQNEFLTLNNGNNTKGCASQKFAQTCGTPTIFKGDKPVRQALSMAIDKAQINTKLVQGKGTVTQTMCMPGWVPFCDMSLENYTPDLSKAKSILDADGWKAGADGVRVKNGVRLATTIVTTGGKPQRVAEEDVVIASAKDIGMEITKDNCSTNCFGDFPSGGEFATDQYGISLFANLWPPDPDQVCGYMQSNQIPTADKPSGQNWGRINNPAYDKACSAEQGSLDIPTRVAAFKDLQKAMIDDGSIFGLYVRPEVNSYAPYAGNFKANASSSLTTWNVPDWFKKGSS
jgi:peptide/nickel transport system substrate-binding protein